MLKNLQNIYSLSRSYFVTFENKSALFSLVSLVAANIFKALYVVSMHERIEAAFDFLRTKEPLTEFSPVFRNAVTRGYLPLIGIDVLTSFLETTLTSACKTAIVRDLTRRWLQEGTFRTLKNLNPELSHNVVRIIGDDSGEFTEKTIELFVQRVMSCVSLVSLFYRMYNLSKSLHYGSAPFPLNYPGGLCALISGFTVVVCGVNLVFHKIIETFYNTARQNSLLVIDRFSSFEANAEQISSMPHSNKENILSYLQTVFNRALRTSSHLRMGQLTGQLTWLLPNAFELMIVYIGFLFMKADPKKFDYASAFLPLIRASLSFIWTFNGAVQGIRNVLQGYAARINDVTYLLEQFDQLRTLRSGISFGKGEKLEVQNLSVTGLEEKSLLKDVNFSLDLGQIYWLKGENGSGKTVLLNAISGAVFNQSEGTVITPQHVVRISEMQLDPQPKTFADLLKEQFGVQDPDVIQNIKTALQNFSSYYQGDQWKIEALGDENPLHNWTTLSRGQAQILNLVVMLISIENSYPNESIALLADEIFSNLDINSVRQTAISLLKDFVKDKNRLVLLVEHNPLGLDSEPDSLMKTNQDRFEIQQLKS